MAVAEERSPDQVRGEIGAERAQLAAAMGSLRKELDLAPKLRSHLPAAAAGAVGAGFLVAGGLGATVRLLFRRGRER